LNNIFSKNSKELKESKKLFKFFVVKHNYCCIFWILFESYAETEFFSEQKQVFLTRIAKQLKKKITQTLTIDSEILVKTIDSNRIV
jgi:hypothetical protein